MVKISREALDNILKKHLLWLENHSKGIVADFSGLDLRGANFSCLDLRSTKFNDAKLNAALFTGADLSYADLRGADLSYADLSGARMNFTKGVISFSLDNHSGHMTTHDSKVTIGCHSYSLEYWLKKFEVIGISENYSCEIIDRYGLLLSYLEKIQKGV